MACLIPVQYHKTKYPIDIKPQIIEVAGHFDISRISVKGNYSLHTEYSFIGRKLDSDILKKYKAITSATKREIPLCYGILKNGV